MKKITKYSFTYEEKRFIEDFSDAVDELCEAIDHCDECPIKQHCAYFYSDDDGCTFGTALVGVFEYFKEYEVK